MCRGTSLFVLRDACVNVGSLGSFEATFADEFPACQNC